MCDTFVALPPATRGGAVIFGKNSDRPRGEAQQTVRFPALRHDPGATVSCTYIKIPEAPEVFEILLSRPDWMWGGEMGANEHGVVIGNEAVWTREELGPPALLGMDLLRLGLERGKSAHEALKAIVALLEACGQGGPCLENDPSFSYHNSFLIADVKEAWVLETAGKHWVAERIAAGARNISNGLTIRNGYDLSSEGADMDFAAAFSLGPVDVDPHSRQGWGRRLLKEREGQITPSAMMDILRHHESGICMHGDFATTAAMVSELKPDGSAAHWLTGAPHPCQNEFKRVEFV